VAERGPSPFIDRILCCADLYQHPLVLAVLGESWHPGGLALTRILAKEIKLSKEDHLLDVASGRGASALMLAQVFKCRVTGIDTSIEALEQARKDAHCYRLENLVTFTQGDVNSLPFPSSSFSSVLCECATALFSDRQSALREIARVLRPGGYLALSDVTFCPEALPSPIDSPLARALCIPLGMGPEAYIQRIGEAGLIVQEKMDYSGSVAQLLDKVESLLGVGRLATIVGKLDREPLRQIENALYCARQLLQQGDLGYWAFIARKP